MNNPKFTWIRRGISSFIICAFLLCGYLFLNTEKGLEIAVQLGKQILPGNLKIAEINGRILGPIQVKQLNYTSINAKLFITEAKFDWHWSSLLKGQLDLGPLFIDKLNLFIKENNNSKKSKPYQAAQLPKILKHLKFSTVNINQVSIHLGTIDFFLQGSLHQQWLFNWQLNIPELTQFTPNLQGKLVLEGKIIGAQFSPEFYIASRLTNLQYGDWQFKQIQAVFDVNIAKTKKWQLDIKTININNKKITLTPFQLKLSGYIHPFSLLGTLYDLQLNRITVNQSINVLIPKTQITSKLSKRGLETTITTEQGNKNQLFSRILLPDFHANSWLMTKQRLSAQIHLNLKDLTLLSSLIPELKNPQGLLDAQLNLIGPLLLPKINLTINLKGGDTEIPNLGLNLKNIQFHLHTDKNQLLGMGQLNSGKGSLSFNTKTQLIKNLSTLISLEGKDVSIIHTSAYRITASPQLNIQADTQQIKTQGSIFFPQARIKINSKNANLADLSDDIRFVDDKKKPIVYHFIFKNNIKVQLGNDIHFQYQGLSTKLMGLLSITQASDHPILATGQLKLSEGEYTYYGQSLKLQPNSSLNFANTPIDDPKLYIIASRKIWILPNVSPSNTTADIKSNFGSANFIQSAMQSSQITPTQLDIGVHLQGSLQNPTIVLFADPSNIIKSQLDMLSYLITGQPSNQLSAASTELLFHAASNLGSEKSNVSQFISKAQKKIGIDQLTIGSKPIFNPNTNSLQQNTSLIVGKNFSPKLNISYSVGLLDPISILQINYLLNKNFYLQSTSSNFADGIDLLYKIEKF